MNVAASEANGVAKLTGESVAAVAVVAVQGPKALQSIMQCWRSASGQSTFVENRIYYGHWTGNVDEIDIASEDVVICRTGEQQIEIHCHGGKVAADRILDDLKSLGIEAVHSGIDPLSQDFDLVQSQAMKDAALASTTKSLHVLINQVNGMLSNALRDAAANETSTMDERRQFCHELIARGRVGLQLLNPPQVAILGPPNSGKSTLLNALLGWDRAIVDPTPGTTRDVLCEDLSLDGWPLRILDTAGLRDTQDSIEKEGISRAMSLAQRATAILLLVDPTQGWLPIHDDVLQRYHEKVVVVATKTDLAALPWASLSSEVREFACAISAIRGEGLEALVELLVRRIGFDNRMLHQAVPSRQEQIDALEQAIKVAGEGTAYRKALQSMLEL